MKSSFTASRVQPCTTNARQEAGAREEVVRLLDVAVDEHVLPGHEHVVHDEHGVVLVEPAGERLIERARPSRRRVISYERGR